MNTPWQEVAAPQGQAGRVAQVMREVLGDRDEIPVIEAWTRLDATVAVHGDAGYPDRLAARDASAPPFIAWRGDGGLLHADHTAAIVGSRRASGYGSAVAAWLADGLAAAGVTVVSGGAIGIDAAAHRAAMHLRGGTIVVLGCGMDVMYPRPHARPEGLFDRILASGGAIVSRYLPGTPPRPGAVLARNRIVAGLADAVVVVEGGARSGALATASTAADLGVPVLAVPGDVRQPGSVAPHRLLAEGAAPCTCPADVLAALGSLDMTITGPVEPGAQPSLLASVLPDPVMQVLAARWPRPIHIDELARACHLETAAVLAAVTRGRVAGEVVEGLDGVRLARGR